MAKMKLDPKKIAAVKQVAAGTIGKKLAEKAQQLKGGVNLSAYDKAAGKKLLTGNSSGMIYQWSIENGKVHQGSS
jgi:hypothetical protein